MRDPFPYPDCCAGCSTNRPDIDLSAINARLQTPAHCAIQLRSLEVLEIFVVEFHWAQHSQGLMFFSHVVFL